MLEHLAHYPSLQKATTQAAACLTDIVRHWEGATANPVAHAAVAAQAVRTLHLCMRTAVAASQACEHLVEAADATWAVMDGFISQRLKSVNRCVAGVCLSLLSPPPPSLPPSSTHPRECCAASRWCAGPITFFVGAWVVCVCGVAVNSNINAVSAAARSVFDQRDPSLADFVVLSEDDDIPQPWGGPNDPAGARMPEPLPGADLGQDPSERLQEAPPIQDADFRLRVVEGVAEDVAGRMSVLAQSRGVAAAVEAGPTLQVPAQWLPGVAAGLVNLAGAVGVRVATECCTHLAVRVMRDA